MDVANASMYDGATALAEALLLAYSHHNQKRTTMLLSSSIHPEYAEVAATYMRNLDVDLVKMPEHNGCVDVGKVAALLNDKMAALVVASPNFYGLLEDAPALTELAHKAGAIMISIVNPISLGILDPPGAYGADIAIGEGQPLGIPMSWGGFGFGFFAAREEHLRRIPGRLVGQTVDQDGKRGFVLTLQTREQHIRREKATSNICTNQALMALRGLLYLVCLGKEGIREVANQCVQKAHYLANRIQELKGFSLCYDAPFFHEFVVRCPKPAKELLDKLAPNHVYGGVALERWFPERTHDLLIAVTETLTKEQLDTLVIYFKAIS
jgi:glycine dehydrogenase subunit 1